MSVVRWSPWQELESIGRQLGRLLDDRVFDAIPERGAWTPAVDIHETEDALIVQAELPGIDKKDVHVEVRDGALNISGERRYTKDVNKDNVHRVERVYGKFFRSFMLPTNVDPDHVTASMKDGVLEVRLPKLESAKPKAITIE